MTTRKSVHRKIDLEGKITFIGEPIGYYIQDIVDAMAAAGSFIEEMSYDEFIADQKTVYASIRAIQIIGEAAKKVPEVVRVKYPHVPWREMAGMRDKVTHEYFGVQMMVLWNALKDDIPPLIDEIVFKSTLLRSAEKSRTTAIPSYFMLSNDINNHNIYIVRIGIF